jgi:hypothetical protein
MKRREEDREIEREITRSKGGEEQKEEAK